MAERLMVDTVFNSQQEIGELVRRKSLTEGVFELLHQWIVAGRYHPGDWLRQEEISTQLRVSQTPVREALDRLVSVGLAERVPYRGVRVPEPTQLEIVDAYVMRLLLECTLARLAAQNSSLDQHNLLQDLVSQMKPLVTLEDISTLRQLNRQFHGLIAEASGNLLMRRLYEVVANRFPDWRLYEYMFRHPELLAPSLEQELQEHSSIADAIVARSADMATLKSYAHIHNLADELTQFLAIPADLLASKEEQIFPLLGIHFDSEG
jgi:DNA-binding GntR family transcriptional regulator